jgi:hypothetical protein
MNESNLDLLPNLNRAKASTNTAPCKIVSPRFEISEKKQAAF